jgi:hypothetical protein
MSNLVSDPPFVGVDTLGYLQTLIDVDYILYFFAMLSFSKAVTTTIGHFCD